MGQDETASTRRSDALRANVRRIALVVVALVVIGAVALVAGFSVAFHRSPVSVIMGHITPTPEELFHKDHILVLAEGLDYDYTDKDQEFSSNARSDVIKAINLDFRTKNVYVVSIPRDMDVVLPSGDEAKINQAQADGGVREAQKVIAKFLGVPGFDRYILLRINATKDLINAIGGIDIKAMNSDALLHEGPNGPIDYDDNWGHLHIHFKPGMQHMTGEQAVAYARFRHDWCSDRCRILRQDQVMQAALTKLKTDKVGTLMHLNDLINVFRHDVQTNLTQAEELSLAQAFSQMPKDGLHKGTIPDLGDKELTYAGDVLIPDDAGRAKMVESMLLNPPLPTPTPDANAIAAISPFSVRVDVENGTGVPGMAKRVAALLKEKGFVIGSVGNASTMITTTEVHEHSNITFAGIKVREALGKAGKDAQVVADSESPAPESSGVAESDVTVIVGQDLASALTQQAVALP